MKKIELKIKYHLGIMLILIILLAITISYGWYTTNKNVSGSGIIGITSTENLNLKQSAIFKDNEVQNPFPSDTGGVEISQLLPGEKVFYSIKLSTIEADVVDLKIDVNGIDGGDYFHFISIDENGVEKKNYYYTLDQNDNKIYYNMSNLFTIKLNSIWFGEEIQDLESLKSQLSENYSSEKRFTNNYKLDPENNIVIIPTSIELIEFYNWNSTNVPEITFVFELYFSSDDLPNEVLYDSIAVGETTSIPANAYGNKTLIFDNIHISAEEE